MSKTTTMRNDKKNLRWQLLVTVSAAALLASAYGASEAEAAGSDRPLIWIELGGQLDRLRDQQETFTPPFMASITQANLLSALNVQRPPAFAIDGEGKISFQPDGSNWTFSASIQYGRSGANKHRHQQTANADVPKGFTLTLPPPFPPSFYVGGYSYYPFNHVKFSDGQSSQSESHLVLDFRAGKDVGLGMFGLKGTSVVSAGVRFARFESKQSVNLRAEPDVQYPTAPITASAPISFLAFRNSPTEMAKYEFQHPHLHFHDYAASAFRQQSFNGIGPKLSWDASTPVAGNDENAELTLDWGVNAAVLFGRQKASGHHTTTVKSYYMTRWKGGFHQGKIQPGIFQGPCPHPTNQYQQYEYVGGACATHTNTVPHDRSRNVTVPNLGGFAGLSLKWTNAKISFGYRADFFFNAIDGGIDTRKSENRGFYGPFASVSVGLGD